MLNLNIKPHRTSLRANTNESQKLFVMLKVIPDREVAKTRPPLALVLVVDTSYSMEEANKLQLAISAAHSLIDDRRLIPEDRLAIVSFDEYAKTIMPLKSLTNKQEAHQAIDSLKTGGGTHMGDGLKAARKQLNSLSKEVAKRVIVLTDGQTFDEPICESLAPQFSLENTPIITIGVGSEYNQELLFKLADTSQGRSYHLSEDMVELSQIIEVEVSSTTKEVITDLQASISTIHGISFNGISRIYPNLAEVNLSESRQLLGNIVAGDYTIFILDFDVSIVEISGDNRKIAQIGLSGHAPALNKFKEFPVQNLEIQFTNDETKIALVNEEVLGYVQQKNLTNMVQQATQQANLNNSAQAGQTLQSAINMTKRLGNSGVTKILENALDELNQTGNISVNTAKTIRAGGRTKTIKTSAAIDNNDNIPSQDEIRRITGT